MIAWTIYLTFFGAILLLVPARASGRAGSPWLPPSLEPPSLSLPSSRPPISELPNDRAPPLDPDARVNYHLAVDGISLTLALVTGITAISAVLFSWNVTSRPNEFFFWLLLSWGFMEFFSAPISFSSSFFTSS